MRAAPLEFRATRKKWKRPWFSPGADFYGVRTDKSFCMDGRIKMKKISARKTSNIAVAALLLATYMMFFEQATADEKVSALGKYNGYSKPDYDGSKRFSSYLKLSDGTKLAYDLFLPTKNGICSKKPMPVLFKYTPYLRAFTIFDRNGKNLIADLFSFGWKERCFLRIRYWFSKKGDLIDARFSNKWLNRMLEHGYAVMVVEMRGAGASFGVNDPSYGPSAKDGSDIIDWIASQTWCDGNIGMFGSSSPAMNQFAIAATGNPRLKAIFPVAGSLDLYASLIHRGGIYNKGFMAFLGKARHLLDMMTTPVDDDKGGILLAQALEERKEGASGTNTSNPLKENQFRDAVLPDGSKIWEDHASLYPFIGRINRSNVPAYLATGWYDLFTEDMFHWFNNLQVPRKLTVRPLDHSNIDSDQYDLEFGIEVLRWFDYWLKGIDNGIMDEPPIHYYTMYTGDKGDWKSSEKWPLDYQKMMQYNFDSNNTENSATIKSGLLTSAVPGNQEGYDRYSLDYTTTSGKNSRWTAVNWPREYGDMALNDKKALCYTTLPLENDVEVTGHPVIHLWLQTEASDLDVFAYLEEVDRKGKSVYLTEGNLRASHRKLSQAPYENSGLPYHAHYRNGLMPISEDEPIELLFSLLPTSYVFQKGKRIRVTVAFADADNYETPIIDPAPMVKLLRDTIHTSNIQLPIIVPKMKL